LRSTRHVACFGILSANMDKVALQAGSDLDRAARSAALMMLLLVGSMWGLTFSFAKAASEAGIGPLAYGFWQTTGAGSVLLLVCALRRERLRLDRHHLAYCLICGALSLAAPNFILQLVIGHVPAGVAAIIITTIPLVTYPLAMAAKLEVFVARRAIGLILGFMGALVLVVPKASLPEPAMAGSLLCVRKCLCRVAAARISRIAACRRHALGRGILASARRAADPQFPAADHSVQFRRMGRDRTDHGHQSRLDPLLRNHAAGRAGLLQPGRLCGDLERNSLGHGHFRRAP
jgi:hypothetical protein